MKNTVIGGLITLVLCAVFLPSANVSAAAPAPECVSFEASKTNVTSGDRVNLSWKTDHATRVEMEPWQYKSTIESTVESGDVTVFPKKTTKYTLTASRGALEDSCSVTVKVDSDGDSSSAVSVKSDTKKPENSVTAFVTRDQQPLTSLAISALPYTGVDMTPYLVVLFFALLAAWGYGALHTLGMTEKRKSVHIHTSGGVTKSTLIPHKEYHSKFQETQNY